MLVYFMFALESQAMIQVIMFRPDYIWFWCFSTITRTTLTLQLILLISCSKDPGYIKRPGDLGSSIDTEVCSFALTFVPFNCQLHVGKLYHTEGPGDI